MAENEIQAAVLPAKPKPLTAAERAQKNLRDAAVTHLVMQRAQLLHKVAHLENAQVHLVDAKEHLAEVDRLLGLHGWQDPEVAFARSEPAVGATSAVEDLQVAEAPAAG